MKWYIILLLSCFTFTTIVPEADGRGRSRSRSVKAKKRSASVPKRKAPSAKPKVKPRSASAPARARSQSVAAQKRPPPPKPLSRSASKAAARDKSPAPATEKFARTATKDQIHSQPVTEMQGVVKPKAGHAPTPVKFSNNKNKFGQQKTYYRGVKDTANLPKGQEKSYVDNAFKNGIPSNARIKDNVPGVHDPKAPTVTNVWQHQNKSAQNSAFVATTKSKKVAATKYSGPSGGFFEIKPKDSTVVNVNKSVNKKTTDKAKLADKEYGFLNEVPSKEIKAFHKVDNKGKVIQTTPNPYFGQ